MKDASGQSAPRAFAYRAQTADGDRLDGRITALSADAARWKLAAMGLRITELSPAPPEAEAATGKARPLSGDDFAAFNQQLAQLTAAGLPIEQGLRLIAQDLGGGRLAEAVRAVAADLEAGMPLRQAFGRHSGRFPPLYGRLMEAGVVSGNLSAMLLNLGRHLELVRRLRRSLWEAAAYPIMVIVAAALLLGFIGVFIVPPMREAIGEAASTPGDAGLPTVTRVVFAAARVALPGLVGMVAIGVGVSIWWGVMRRTGRAQAWVEWFLLPMPLIGPVLERNLAARWCDAVALAVAGGQDLPTAIELAGDAIGSEALRADGQALIDSLVRGGDLRRAFGLRVLGGSVAATLDTGGLPETGGELAQQLATLRDLYEAQAEYRLAMLNAVIRPAMIIGVGLLLGAIILGLFLPLIQTIQNMTG